MGSNKKYFMLFRVENRYNGHYFWQNYVVRNNSNKLKLTKIMVPTLCEKPLWMIAG